MQARNTSMLAQCFYQLEDFASLTKLVEVLTEGQPMLADIGHKLQSVGLCTEAVAAFSKVCPAAADTRSRWACVGSGSCTSRRSYNCLVAAQNGLVLIAAAVLCCAVLCFSMVT
jgi:hypothetical protein